MPESDRLDAVRQHHKKAKCRAGNPRVHAAIHVTVENQLAEGHPEATATMARLLAEGLDRHEALHAIGSIVAHELFDILKSNQAHDPAVYARRLRALSAASWRAGEVE